MAASTWHITYNTAIGRPPATVRETENDQGRHGKILRIGQRKDLEGK